MDEPPTKKQKKEKKAKKEKKEEKEEPAAPAEVDYETRCKACGPISSPLANKKLTKKLHKLVKKASGVKGIRRGVKEVVKALRKNEKGLCIIAGDISPIDVISHIPVFCEEKEVDYIYVPSKQDLGAAASTKRPTSVVLVQCKKDFAEKALYDECVGEVKDAHK
jgi:H/ACA ribonucleoprotein complex subunit 2